MAYDSRAEELDRWHMIPASKQTKVSKSVINIFINLKFKDLKDDSLLHNLQMYFIYKVLQFYSFS